MHAAPGVCTYTARAHLNARRMYSVIVSLVPGTLPGSAASPVRRPGSPDITAVSPAGRQANRAPCGGGRVESLMRRRVAAFADRNGASVELSRETKKSISARLRRGRATQPTAPHSHDDASSKWCRGSAGGGRRRGWAHASLIRLPSFQPRAARAAVGGRRRRRENAHPTTAQEKDLKSQPAAQAFVAKRRAARGITTLFSAAWGG